MAEISRRDFLIRGGTGAAALSALAVLPQVRQSVRGHRAPAATGRNGAATTIKPTAVSSKHVVAYIPNPESGEIHYMVGTREVVHKDPALVERMLRETD